MRLRRDALAPISKGPRATERGAAGQAAAGRADPRRRQGELGGAMEARLAALVRRDSSLQVQQAGHGEAGECIDPLIPVCGDAIPR